MTIAEAAKACSELVKCGCKSQRGCASHSVCMKAGLPALTCVTVDVKLTDGSITFITVTTNYN